MKGNRGSRMATEGNRKKRKAEKLAEMDRELADIRAEIEKLELRMRQDEELVQVCEPETGKVSMMMMRMNWDRLMISRTAMKAKKKKLQLAKRATN
jgi:hypothetical protein